MSIVCLCQCDLSVDYEHSMTFNNRSEQYNYIRGNVYKILDLNIPNDSHRKEFEVNLSIQDCKKSITVLLVMNLIIYTTTLYWE